MRFLRIIGLVLIIISVVATQVFGRTMVHSVPISPPDGKAYLGVQLDWDKDSIDGYAKRLGYRPGVYGIYMDYPLKKDDEIFLSREVSLLAKEHSILMLTLEPNKGLDTVTPDSLDELTAALNGWNSRGVPVIVRFAHEMNGSWYPWAQQPTKYIAVFRTVANAVHRAPDSVMLWSPNEGGGYPFTGGPYAIKPSNPDFKLLDTNHDGVLSMYDNPYEPYYPGDTYVDWVGLSVYHFGYIYPWGKNVVPEEKKLVGKITGTFKSQYVDETMLPNFYYEYAVKRNHPFAISETGSLYIPGNGQNSEEITIKSAWWKQLFGLDVKNQFKMVKLVMWFEHEKVEHDTMPSPVDWRVTDKPEIRNAFRQSFPSWLTETPNN